MKTINKITYLLIIAGLLSITACKKEEDKPVNTHDDAYGDVITKKMMMMGNAKYVPIFFSFFEGIVADGSSVKAPDGTVYDLHEFWAGPGLLTGNGNVGNTIPQAGTYTFTLKFSDGYVKTVTDVLEGEDTTVPQITVNYNANANPQTIDVSWTPSPEADFYCIKMTDLDMANNKPFFKKPMIAKSQTSFTITLDGSNGWMRPVSELQNGTDYYVVVSAKKVESGTQVTGMSKNFEVNGCNKTTITYQQ